MSYTKKTWKNNEGGKTPILAADLNHIEEGIATRAELVALLTVSDTAPTTCSTGDMYYNSTNNKIYTATDTNTWGTTGENPSKVYLYVDLANENLYYYDGSEFKSYGGGSSSGDTLPIGSTVVYGGSTAPTNWLICDGSAVSRTTYADLFSAIGTSYGAGDGSTTFNLPNLKGKVPVGLNSTDTDFNSLGKTGGEKTHTLTIGELAEHDHIITTPKYYSSEVGTGSIYGAETISTSITRNTSKVGSNQPHNNLQPYIVVNYIIKAFQSAGVVAQVSNTKSESTTDTYSCDYINGIAKKLWSGEFTSGSITISGISKYKILVVNVGGCCCFGTKSFGMGGVGEYGSYASKTYNYRLNVIGDVVTIDDLNKGGSDGTTNVAITEIYGLF